MLISQIYGLAPQFYSTTSGRLSQRAWLRIGRDLAQIKPSSSRDVRLFTDRQLLQFLRMFPPAMEDLTSIRRFNRAAGGFRSGLDRRSRDPALVTRARNLEWLSAAAI
jgi:hypothetical protein